jgi:hypothetical protein
MIITEALSPLRYFTFIDEPLVFGFDYWPFKSE